MTKRNAGRLFGLYLFIYFTSTNTNGRKLCKINVAADCDNTCSKFLKDEKGCFTCTCEGNPAMKDIIEGDIKLDEETAKLLKFLMTPKSKVQKAAARNKYARRWDNLLNAIGMYEIPYEIHDSINNITKLAIEEAAEEFYTKSCIYLRPRMSESNYIIFTNDGGCSSSVGRKTGKHAPNKISLLPMCGRKGIIIHELMHALGFFHEQSRPDRNKFIRIMRKNIADGKSHNFKKYSRRIIYSMNSSYDIYSIMHYRSYAFSKNGQPTILTRNGTIIPPRLEFSKADLEQLNHMYNCRGISGPTILNATTTEPSFNTTINKIECTNSTNLANINTTSTTYTISPNFNVTAITATENQTTAAS